MIPIAEIITILQKHELLIENINTSSSNRYSGIQTDSRKIREGHVFVCIFGFVVDGHDYAQKAVDSGAKLLIV